MRAVYPGEAVPSGRNVGLRIADLDAAVSVLSVSLVPRYGLIAVGKVSAIPVAEESRRTFDERAFPHATSVAREQGLLGGPGAGLTLTGTVDELNEILATAVYRGSPDWYDGVRCRVRLRVRVK